MHREPYINVGILKGKVLEFRLSGKFDVRNDQKSFYNDCVARNKGENIILENNDNQFCFGKILFLDPCNISADYFEVKNVSIGIDFHWEQKEIQKFRGSLYLLTEDDEINLINIIPAENYLISVISSEMNANSSPELLKAHAIISRSWLLAQLKTREPSYLSGKTEFSENQYISWFDREDHLFFDVCADDHCQRYQGINRTTNKNVIKAVDQTRGMVLTFEGEICDARYSKSCGGHTELFKNCWEETEIPYLKAFPDFEDSSANKKDLSIEKNASEFILNSPVSFCNTDKPELLQQVLNDYDQDTKDFYRWKLEYSQEEISGIIKEKSGLDFGKIIGFEPVERGKSGRLVKLRIWGTEKEMLIGKELIIRKWLSPSHLYSSAIVIESSNLVDNIPQKFIIHGAGWGHGVGLCQVGAAVMAEKGYKFEAILAHYYQGAIIEKHYS